MTRIFGIMSAPLGLVISQLYNIIGNYAITLIVITVVIKVLLYPLYKKQIMSMASMGDLQPLMKDIQNKYANDPVLMREKTAELYQEHGVNPMGGCLPMAIQMIVIMGLFGLLRNPLMFIKSDKMIFAIHESFLWIKDLSQPDLWVLPIMAGVATFFAFFIQNKVGTPGTQMAGGGMQKAMMFVFPLMIVWLARSYPAGLAIYWFMSQFIQIFYNIRFAKLKKEMRNKKKFKKKK